MYNKYKKNTILIINNFNGLNFDISKEEKMNFLEEGYRITKKCFDEKIILNYTTQLITELMTKKETNNTKKTKKKTTKDIKLKYVSIGIQTD